MKVSAINTAYVARVNRARLSKVNEPTAVENPTGVTAISFKSGNPRHLFHQISELELFGFNNGGVATVGNDLFWNIDNFDRVVENVPLYNQDVKWVKDVDPKTGEVKGVKRDGVSLRRIPKNLPNDHPFKPYENMVFVTKIPIGKDQNIAEFLKQKDKAESVFILEELKTSNIEWGLEKEIPVGIYRAKKDERFKNFLREKGWNEEQINKIDLTFTYVDATASMPKQYADGSYSSATGDAAAKRLSMGWQGLPYPKEAKSTAELLPALKEHMGGFDPKFITCHDGQAMPLIHFIAAKNATGDAYWQDKVVTAVGHNLNDGYMYSLGMKDAVVMLAQPGEIETIINSKEYTEALKYGREESFLKSLLPKNILDGRGQTNAVMLPISYGEKGFVPMFTTVSHDYYKSIIENELVSPALFKRLRELSDHGHFNGIMNVLMDPNKSGFTIAGLGTYAKNECKIKLKDGTEVVLPKFVAFDESKKYDLKSMRDVKRQNKIALLKRLNKDFAGSDVWGKINENEWGWIKNEGLSAAVTGKTGKTFSFVGGIDSKFMQMLEQGKDVPMFISWGRGDFQKGMDTGLEAFVKFVKKTGNKDSILVMGGDMKNLKKEVIEYTEKLLEKDADLKGRILVLNGWAPGDLFAAAGDYSNLFSRFAPCELTDLESMKKGCIPLVPKVQGMNQKVFDPNDTEHAQYINGYKGAHEYYMTEEVALSVANKEEQEIFNKAKDKVKETLEKDYKSKIGEQIPDNLLAQQLKNNDDYQKALQRLRDSVISDEGAGLMERAIKDRNSDVAEKIWKNHVDLKTTWKENGWLNPGGKSTAELYNELHYNTKYGKNLTKDEVLKLDLSKLTSAAQETKPNNEVTFGSKIATFFKSKKGKWTAGIAGAVALAGVGYAYYKKQHPAELDTIDDSGSNDTNVASASSNAQSDKHMSAVV